MAVDQAAARRRQRSVGMGGDQLPASHPWFLPSPDAAADVATASEPDQVPGPDQGGYCAGIQAGFQKLLCAPQVHSNRKTAAPCVRHGSSLRGLPGYEKAGGWAMWKSPVRRFPAPSTFVVIECEGNRRNGAAGGRQE